MEPNSSVQSALLRMSEALELALEADEAWRIGDEGASNLCNSAEQAYRELLNLICGLSEEDADLAEPAFTVFENRLLRLCKNVPAGQTS